MGKLQVGVKDCDAVLERLWLEVQLFALRIHPVDPVATIYDVEGAGVVNATVSLEGREATEDCIHGNLSMERLGSIANSLRLVRVQFVG